MTSEENPVSYKQWAIDDAALAIEEFREIQNRNSTVQEFLDVQDELVSAVNALEDSFTLPEKTVRFYRKKAHFQVLTCLARSVKDYHMAISKQYPTRVIEAKDRIVASMIDLSGRLKIDNSIMIKTVLKSTPEKQRVRQLYRFYTNGQITKEQGDKIAAEFKL